MSELDNLNKILLEEKDRQIEDYKKLFLTADGENKALRETIDNLMEVLKGQQWNDASKRPPKEGRYLVWGLHEFTPDHNDQPNAYWQTRIANWSDHLGWDTKVKFWMELPEPPENKGR